MDKEQIVEVTVMYPARQGFIMLAHKIQQHLAQRTDTPVRLEEQPNGHFSIIINDTTVHSCCPLQTCEVDQAEIFAILGRYNMPEATGVKTATNLDDHNDPDHLQWMNCVCSGE